MVKFEFDEKQNERADKWAKLHIAEKHPKGVRDSDGAWVEYKFLPSCSGTNCTMRCIYCDAKINLTLDEDDTGDFLFNEDGTRNPKVWGEGK